MYLSSAGTLPAGGRNPFAVTWYHGILPYIDQTALYDGWDSRQPYYQGNNQNIAETPASMVRCPSDINVPFYPTFSPADVNSWFTYWRGNYVCNAGNIGVSGTGSGHFTVLPSRTLGGNTITNGGQPFIVSIDNGNFRYVAVAEVTDGLSNTLAFSECLQGTPNTVSMDLRGMPYHAAFCWFTTWLSPNTPDPDVTPDSSGCCVSVSGRTLPFGKFSGRTEPIGRSQPPSGRSQRVPARRVNPIRRRLHQLDDLAGPRNIEGW